MFRRLALGPPRDTVHGPHLDRPHHLLHDRSRARNVRRRADDGAVHFVEARREGVGQQPKFRSRDGRIHLRHFQRR